MSGSLRYLRFLWGSGKTAPWGALALYLLLALFLRHVDSWQDAPLLLFFLLLLLGLFHGISRLPLALSMGLRRKDGFRGGMISALMIAAIPGPLLAVIAPNLLSCLPFLGTIYIIGPLAGVAAYGGGKGSAAVFFLLALPLFFAFSSALDFQDGIPLHPLSLCLLLLLISIWILWNLLLDFSVR